MKVNYLRARGLSRHPRTLRRVKDSCSSSYSEWNTDQNWSSQEWKPDDLMEVRTGRFLNEHPPAFRSQSTLTDLLLMTMMWTLTSSQNQTCREKFRSFLHRVNDRVRKMLDQSSKDATQKQQQTFFKMVNVSVFDITSICIHGKEIT